MKIGNYIFNKTLIFTITVITVAIIAAAYIVVMLAVFLIPQKDDTAAARIKVHFLQNKLEQNNLQFLPESGIAYAVFDLTGKNLGSTLPQYQGDIDIRLLSSAKEYTAPLIIDSEQIGVLVVDLPVIRQWSAAFWVSIPAFVLLAASGAVTMRHFFFVRHDIIRPLNELKGVVRKIIQGDLNVPISYDYDGEMGTFCHAFESMRDQLRDAELRERNHQEKERLLFASLSHDLKTPLSSISGYAESIKYGVVKEPPDFEKYVDIILSKTKNLTHSIEDILTHVQTQMHEMSIKKEEIYSKPFIREIFADISVEASAKGFVFEVQEEIPNLLITVDPMRISQAIQNVVSNAFKYTSGGGKITMSAVSGGGFLHISAEDTGCGIRAEDLPFVFEPFFRGEKSRNPNISGSGLGLSIAKYIIGQHGGKISCESVWGEGTRVTMRVEI